MNLSIESIHLLTVILFPPFLIVNDLDDPLVADIAEVLKLDKEQHDQTAEEWTRRYAMTGKKD